MEETLDDLKRKLKNIASKISDKMNERQNYLDQAAEIQKIYDRMLQDKKTLKKYKSDIRTFYNKSYTDFKGNKFSYTYKPSIQELGNSYDAVISRIDTNLDALNTKKSEYNNKASGCLGPLGSLESSYNYVKTKVQNWTN